jgi:autotransporter-associated beta strand protein
MATGGNWSASDWYNASTATNDTATSSAATTELDFNSSSTAAYTAANNISSPFDLNILSFGTGSGTSGADTVAISTDELQFEANASVNPVINLNDTYNESISAPVDMEANLTIQGSSAGIFTLSGALTGPSAYTLTKSASNQVDITHASNMYTGGTSITAGILLVSANNALGSGTISIGGSAGPKLQLYGSGSNSYTYDNDLVVTGGNAAIEADYNSTISGPGTVASSIASGDTLTLQNNSSGAVGTITNAIGGAGALVRGNSQAGSWVLSGNNTYTGTTTVSAGLLAITGITSGQGSYSVGGAAATAGILTGSGTIGLAAGKSLTVAGYAGSSAGNAILEPTSNTGAAGTIGTLTVLSAGTGSMVTLGNLSTLSITVAASSNSELVVGSLTVPVAFTISSTSTLALTGTFGGGNYTIANYFGALAGTGFGTITVNGSSVGSVFTANGYMYDVSYTFSDMDGGTDIELVAVPEPSSIAGILALLALMICAHPRGRYLLRRALSRATPV